MLEPASRDDDRYSEWRGRRRFHFALAGVFLPCLSLFLSWGLAFRQQSDGSRRWKRLLYGLACVDTLVFACLIAITTKPSMGTHTPAHAPRRIGITLQSTGPSGTGIEIARVVPGGPADNAGLRTGDVITRLDGKRVRDNQSFAREIGQSGPGQLRHVHARRNGAGLDVYVTPRLGVKFPASRAPPLFARVPGHRHFSWSAAEVLHEVSGELATLFVLLLVAAVAWRRRVRLVPLSHVALGVIVPVLVMFAVSVTFQKTLGLSLGAVLVSTLTATLTMLGIAALAIRRLDEGLLEAAEPDEPLGTARAFGRGVFYTFTLSARAGVLLAVGAPIMHLPEHPASQVFPVSLGWGAAGVSLFALGAVVAAPLAEECLFRGVLLPWLASWMKPELAIVVSALAFGIGHLFYGADLLIPFVYGLVLAWMRLHTGKLRAGIAVHMLINTVATLALLLSG